MHLKDIAMDKNIFKDLVIALVMAWYKTKGRVLIK